MKNRVKSPMTWLFVGVQCLGLLCMNTWKFLPSEVSSFIWGTAIVLLFPGNFLGTLLTEKLLWKSGWPLTAMLAVEIPVLILINAAVWLGAVKTGQRLIRT